jgi:uncharacterized membrane protein
MSERKYYYKDARTGEEIEITKEEYELIERLNKGRRK